MPKRHLCEAFEAGEKCEDVLCSHADDGTQYIFESIHQVFMFHMMPDELKMPFCLLMDLGFASEHIYDE